MSSLNGIYEARCEKTIGELSSACDCKEAGEQTQKILDAVFAQWMEAEEDGVRRVRAREMQALLREAAGALTAASQTSVAVLPARTIPRNRTGRERFQRILRYVPSGLCLLLGVWLFFEGRTNAMAMALAAGVLSFMTVREAERPVVPEAPRVEAVPRVDVRELDRRIKNLLRLADEILAREETEAAPTAPLSRMVLEAAQMLLEAQLTEDGDFALKGVSRLADALRRDGVEIQMYTEETKDRFDLLPARKGGDTIRPAFCVKGEVLLRGQATFRA